MPSSKRPSVSGPGFDPTEVIQTPMESHDERTAATSAPTPAPRGFELAAGTMVGEYRVETKIGAGGMGVVFAAVHPMIGKRAAIKILRQELCTDHYAVERFIDEARVVNQIGHPNIVDVFAFGTIDGRHYFVMEWLKGEPLRTRIARGPISLVELHAWVRPLTRALMAAHAKGVVHRDLKPDNVFLVDVGEDLPVVKLLDFGIAKLAHTEHRMEQTASGVLVGTPQYISPEQAKGIAIDLRSDVYALGVIVFEMLTGRLPFVASSAMEVIAMHLMEAPPRPSSIAAVPRELDDLVLAMLAKDPAQRPPLALVCEALDRVKAGTYEIVQAHPSPAMATATATAPAPMVAPVTSTLPPRAPWRSLRWIALPVVALVGGTIAFVAVTSSSSSTTTAPAPTPAPAIEMTPAPAPAVPASTSWEPTPMPPSAVPVVAPAPAPAPIVAPSPPRPAQKPATTKHVTRPKPTKPTAGVGSDSGEMFLEPGTLGPPKPKQDRR